MFAFPPHTSHVSLRSLSTISDLNWTYGRMTRSSMTGFLRRLSGNPPNMAMRGFFCSRWMVNCRHFRGPSGVFVVALRRFDSFVVLVWFLLAKVFRSDVSIVHFTLVFRTLYRGFCLLRTEYGFCGLPAPRSGLRD